MDEENSRKFYRRRQHKRKHIMTTTETVTEQKIQPPNNQDIFELGEFECFMSYCGQDYSFSVVVDNSCNVDELHRIAVEGLTCTPEEFENFEDVILNSKDSNAIFAKDELIQKISSVRKAMVKQDQMRSTSECDTSIIQNLDDLNNALNNQTPEKETTVPPKNLENVPTLADVVDQNQTQTQPTQTTSSISSENTMNTQTNATNMNANNTEATSADEQVKPNQDQTQSAASTVAAGAALVASTGLVATKGFIERNKKKLLVAGGVVGLSVGGYFAWQRWGAAILGAGEAAAEAVVDQATA